MNPPILVPTARPLHLLDSAGGLPSNQVHRIARDQQSRIWLATPAGIARYDGHFIQQWDRRKGLQCAGLRSVAIDASNVVWIGTDLGFERLHTDGKILPGLAAGVWRLGLCQHIDVSQPTPWIAAAGGLARLDPHADESGYDVGYFADVGFVNHVLCLDPRRTLAVLAQGSLVETDGTRWWQYECEGLAGRTVSELRAGQGGEILVGTDDGMYIIDDVRRVVTGQVKVSGIDPAVGAIAADGDRHWIAFGRTVVACTTDLGGQRILEQFSVDSAVTDLMPDRTGNVFVATNSSGLCQISCLRHAVEKIDLGRAGGVYSIKPLHTDVYDIGGEQLFGTAVLPARGTATTLSSPRGLPSTIVWDSLRDASGTWLATQVGVFHAPPEGELTRMFADDPVLARPRAC